MPATVLADRGVVKVAGAECVGFLQDGDGLRIAECSGRWIEVLSNRQPFFCYVGQLSVERGSGIGLEATSYTPEYRRLKPHPSALAFHE